MSTFHLYCSCVICKRTVTTQSLAAHYRTHNKPTTSCVLCGKPTSKYSQKYCSQSCAAVQSNSKKDRSTFTSGPPPGQPQRSKTRPPYTKISWCPICGRPHKGTGTCSAACKAKRLSNAMKKRIYNGFNPNQNRGRGKQSYLEASFDAWVSSQFVGLPYMKEYPIRRLDTIKTYFADFYFPTKQLIIELDGTQHKYTREYDLERDTYIRDVYGITVIRITHREYTSQSRMSEIMSFLSESNWRPLNGNQLFCH